MRKIFFLILILILASISFAQTTQTVQTAQPSQRGAFPLVRCSGLDCDWAQFITSLQNLIRAMLIIGYWIAAIVALVGAFMVMLGGYQKGWLNTGKSLIINSLVYYVILLLAGVLFDLFLEFLRPKLFGE